MPKKLYNIKYIALLPEYGKCGGSRRNIIKKERIDK